jgi:hypothetical protein
MSEPLEEWSSLAASPDSLTLELVIGIVAGLTTAFITWTLARLVRIGRVRRGHLAGVWYQTSPDPRGVQEVLRVDEVHVHIVGSQIWGYADRQSPTEEQTKRWRFRGKVCGSLIVGYFWTTDIHSNPRSNGTIHLQMVHPFLWVGRYTTAVGAVKKGSTSTVTQELKDLPLEWSREPPARHRPGSEESQSPS